MCNYMMSETRKCAIISKGDLCHIHINKKRKFIPKHEQIDIELKETVLNSKIDKLLKTQQNLRKEITNLNNNIIKKNEIIKELKDKKLENTQSIIDENILNELNEIKKINKQLLIEKDNQRQQILYYKNKNKEKEQTINKMKDDYNNFQLIKKYEKEKDNLIKKNIDLYSYNDNNFQKLRKDRNYIVHQLPLIV